jgi:hypothetical protein
MSLEKELNAARALLGPSDGFRLVSAVPKGRSSVKRWTWKCGCRVDGIGRGIKARNITFQWDKCPLHLEVRSA